MATAQRVFYETVTVIVFLVLLMLAWVFSGHRAERRLAAAREEQSQVLARRAEEHRGVLRRLEDEKRAVTRAHRRSEAEAVFRGYAAGLQPAAVARWSRTLAAGREQLLRTDPRVVFVHLVTPGGSVLTSTDPDLTARGLPEEASEWVLGAEGVISRTREGGVLELAGPILDNGRPAAYLWLGYDVDAAAE